MAPLIQITSATKAEVLAQYETQAVIDHGSTVFQVPLPAELDTPELAEQLAKRARHLGTILEEPIAIVVVRDSSTLFLEIRTLGNKIYVLQGLVAYTIGALVPKQHLRPADPNPFGTPESDPPHGYSLVLPGQLVRDDYLMWTDRGWETVTKVHSGRKVELGEMYAARLHDGEEHTA